MLMGSSVLGGVGWMVKRKRAGVVEAIVGEVERLVLGQKEGLWDV